MSNKRNFDELQKLAEKVAEIYVERPEPSVEERAYDPQLVAEVSRQDEKQQLLLEAELAMRKHLEEFERSQRFLGSRYRLLAFLVVFASFAALFFNARLSLLTWPIKLTVLAILLGSGLFSALKKRR